MNYLILLKSTSLLHYKVQFHLKALPKNEHFFALLEVTANWGQNQIVSKKIAYADIVSAGSFENFDLDFSTTKRLQFVEFRIYYYGNADLYLDNISLSEQ